MLPLAGGELRRDKTAMELGRPRFAFREEIFAARPQRAANVRFAGLWVAGSLDGLARATVAIVGPRAPSLGGISRARDLATGLSTAGVCVLSGLALGIDGAAHQGALEGPTPTVGVLGGGHRCFFPKRNRELADRMIAKNGAVLSPYAPDEPARPAQFIQRNGVVAALADAVVIVEAATRSGALNTASWAANLGIDVLAFPGDVDRVVAAGCNALIRDGATLVRNTADVLEAIGIAQSRDSPLTGAGQTDESATATHAPAGSLQSRLLQLLASGPLEAEAIAVHTGAAIGDVIAALVRLEIEGDVERRDMLRFAAIRR